ncbi:type VI secretion system tube protein Hcp [Vibrio aestuarianus]|uniref:type VI secretion system tube protein Hcp n=1 Tax=Vibrio aestuarianus TaxID=28171 RepID=UPI00237D1A34|nr:type VI secretion system tube protein Hcp [Vibrio aestuarianus]MDE1211223.1 type VI secretion system tube protein Hcp [Vibrio aestuarianus]MDE1254693.1 type VI secretion system tube protein Hcp [Vibrio aestuarianus]MDE1319561.1 type VI secretion system tube protein Hcp [Vibrio aestuarianus]
MASIYMRVEGLNVTGGATATDVEGLESKKDGWFAISSYSWGAVRNVSMDIGNANNADSGMVAMSEVNVAKQVDGASEDLLSFLFSPGKEGKTVEIAFTKPKSDGQGTDVYFQVKLEKARLVSYNVSGSDGSQPYESLSFSYVEISQKHHYEKDGGELVSGGLVSYSIPLGKMTSGAK